MTARFHQGRPDLAITDEGELRRLLRDAPHITLAMCDGDEPYLVTVNHVYDEGRACLYFHAATTGRKLRVLAANPSVWGQAVEDGGYVVGKCGYAYRSVHFAGQAALVVDVEEALAAFLLMIRKYEPDPAPFIAKYTERIRTGGALARTAVVRVDIAGMSGRRKG